MKVSNKKVEVKEAKKAYIKPEAKVEKFVASFYAEY